MFVNLIARYAKHKLSAQFVQKINFTLEACVLRVVRVAFKASAIALVFKVVTAQQRRIHASLA